MTPRPTLRLHDLEPATESFRDAVIAGLNKSPKAIPCKFLYDAEGSALFERICETPEYYPTRTESAILNAHGADLARLTGSHCQLVEFGSGASVKTRRLLDAMVSPSAYVAIDISKDALLAAARTIDEDYHLTVWAICADFTSHFDLPLPFERADHGPVGFFPGSTIGNFTPDGAARFLANVRDLLGPGSDMILGVDLQKDPAVLTAAYNDSEGVTAAFSLNLLARINRELDGTFDLGRFRHVAYYDETLGCVVIYLESLIDQSVLVDGERFRFTAGERIHTEYSFKYTLAGFRDIAERAGYEVAAVWTDADQYFSIHYLKG